MFTIFTPFFTLGPASTTLYSTHALCHGLISSTTFLQHSTTLYSLQLYSISTVYNLYNTPLRATVTWGGHSLGEGTSMMEPEIVKNRGLSRVSDGKVRDDWATLGPRVRWTDLEEGSISSCGSSRWAARL